MKFLKRVPILAYVFIAALVLLPYTVSRYLADGAPATSAAYAPYFSPRSQPQATGSEIELLLNNWEFTQTSPIGGGGGAIRPRR